MSQQLDQRLGGLEVKQAQMETSVTGLAQEVSRLSTTIQKIDEHLEKITQPNYHNWIAAIAIIIGVTGGIGGMYIKPIQLQVQHEHERIADMRESSRDRLESEIGTIQKQIDTIDRNFITHLGTQVEDERQNRTMMLDLMNRMSKLETIAGMVTKQNPQ